MSDLTAAVGLQNYYTNVWRLFIDSSKRSFKFVRLHYGNKLVFVLLSLVMLKIKYTEYDWVISIDLKMLHFLLGQQGFIYLRR